jgi:hypothetical protein
MSAEAQNEAAPTQASIWQEIKHPMILACKASILLYSGAEAEVLSESFLTRGAYPEPFDIAAHIGNFREGGFATMVAGGIIGLYTLPQEVTNRPRSPEKIVKRARFAAIGGFLASSAVQLVGEGYGLSNNLLASNTPDMLDAAYGIGWSAVVAGLAYRMGMKYLRKQDMLSSGVNENEDAAAD